MTTEQIRIFELIVSHAQCAARVMQHLHIVDTNNRSLLASLNGFKAGVALLDRGGYVLEMNRNMEQVVAQRDGLEVFNRRITAALTLDQQKLDRAFSDALDPHNLRTLGAVGVAVNRPSGGRPY